MLKLACPKCRLNLRVPAQRVPASGAWAQCPRCRERFFINPAGHSLEELTRPFASGPAEAAPGPAPAPGPASAPGPVSASGPASASAPAASPGRPVRDANSQRLLDRLKAKRGPQADEPDDYEPGMVMVYPEPAIPESVFRAASAAMLCLPLLAIFLIFSFSGSRLAKPAAARPEPEITTVGMLNDYESEAMIRQDLSNLRRDQLMRRRSLYGVGHNGPETRVFQYFMHRLAPNVCAGVRYIQVSVPNSPAGPDAGFTMTGFCEDPEDRRLAINIEWAGRAGLVFVPYNQKTERFSLEDENDPSGRLVRTIPKAR